MASLVQTTQEHRRMYIQYRERERDVLGGGRSLLEVQFQPRVSAPWAVNEKVGA